MDTSEALDLSKENIQPLKQGRNASQLGTALKAQTDSEVHNQLTKEREKYELEIRMYEGEDPLQPRFEYVAWLEQSFPKHGPDSNLIPLLEDTLARFKDDERYKQDPRFVELLVKYFDAQSNPLELYQLVFNQGLGTMCALLYRAWADEFDKNNDMMRADQTYMLGIKNRAQPLDQLKEWHKQFQISVGRRTLGYSDMNYEEVDSYSREALGKLKSKRKVPSIRDNTENPGTFPLGPRTGNNQNQKMKAPVKVYQDNPNDCHFSSHSMAVGGAFPKHGIIQKENSLKPGPWTGQGIKSKKITRAPTTPTFQIHEDDDIDGIAQRTGAVVPRALKPRKLDTFTCPLVVLDPPDPTKKAMYCKHKVYVGGREFQFEELRAAEYMKKLQQRFERNLKTETQTLSTIKVEECWESSDQSHKVIAKQEVAATNGNVSEEPLPKEQDNLHISFNEKKPLSQRFGSKSILDGNASLTVNTKEAMNLVEEMWGSPSPVQVPVKPTRTFIPTINKNTADIFKVPAIPRSKIPQFSLITDNECEKDSSSLIKEQQTGMTPNLCPKFPIFTDDDPEKSQINIPSNDEEIHRKKTPFPVYEDFINSVQYASNDNGLPGDKPVQRFTSEAVGIYNADAENQKESNSNVKNDSNKFSEVGSFGQNCVYSSSKNAEPSVLPASKGLTYTEESINIIKSKKDIVESSFVSPFAEEAKSNFRQSVPYQTSFHSQNKNDAENVIGLSNQQFQHISPFHMNEDTDFTNVTCNTKAFAFVLPSSTPMANHFQTYNQAANVSYMAEALGHKSALPATTQQELSMILESSKERLNSNGHSVTQEVASHDAKQKLTQHSPDDIDLIGKNISTLNLSGDFDPFSTEVISKLLLLIGYPKPCHMAGVHYIDKDLNTLCVNSTIQLDSIKYKLLTEIGKGAYARVLKGTRNEKPVALKFQKPGLPWELYITQELQLRLKMINQTMLTCFMEISEAFIFRNSTVFESEWAKYGSLLDVSNTIKTKTSKVIPVNIVVVISSQMSSIIEHLHKCRIIHGDIKPDNFVVMNVAPLENRVLIKLIDFGRSIDMSLLPAKTTFTTEVSTSGFTCTEMRDKRPWTYQLDMFGLTATIYLLLMGEYMKVERINNKWQPKTPIPRYGLKSLWEPLFSSLLNINSCSEQPNLMEFRKTLDDYLKTVNVYSLKNQFTLFYNVLNGQ